MVRSHVIPLHFAFNRQDPEQPNSALKLAMLRVRDWRRDLEVSSHLNLLVCYVVVFHCFFISILSLNFQPKHKRSFQFYLI